MFDVRELTLPVIGAPMAGGPSTPALAAAVSEVGGLGFLAAGYKAADAVAAEVDAVRATTTAPFGVNLFVIEPYEPDAVSLDAYRRSLEQEAARHGTRLGEARWEDDDWQANLTWCSTCDLTLSRSHSGAHATRHCASWMVVVC